MRALIEGRDAYERSFGIPAAEGFGDFLRFTRVGQLTDPEDGPVWRWEIPRAGV